MVYGAALEMRFGGNPIEGSNPSLSATPSRTKRHFPKVRDRLLIDAIFGVGWRIGWKLLCNRFFPSSSPNLVEGCCHLHLGAEGVVPHRHHRI